MVDLAAISRSMTALQPADRLERCLTMQAVIFGMLGISELQRRKASPVHICCASELKANPGFEENAANEAASVSARAVLRMVNAVILGSIGLARVSRSLMPGPCSQCGAATVTLVTIQLA